MKPFIFLVVLMTGCAGFAPLPDMVTTDVAGTYIELGLSFKVEKAQRLIEIVRCTREVWDDHSTPVYIMDDMTWPFEEPLAGVYSHRWRLGKDVDRIQILYWSHDKRFAWDLNHEFVHRYFGDGAHATEKNWGQQGTQGAMYDETMQCLDATE